MHLRRTIAALVFIGALMSQAIWARDVHAATPIINDLTDFITRLGGYLFPSAGPGQPNEVYWEQVSYKVTSSTGSSNITTITMTKFNRAAVFIATGNGSSTPATISASSTNPDHLNFCATDPYVVETVTLDLRDIKPVSVLTSGTDGSHEIWSVILQTNDGGKLVRQNTQTLPPTCPAAGIVSTSNILQQDENQYAILFADKGQAMHFQQLLSSAIPTLNPLVIAGTMSVK